MSMSIPMFMSWSRTMSMSMSTLFCSTYHLPKTPLSFTFPILIESKIIVGVTAESKFP